MRAKILISLKIHHLQIWLKLSFCQILNLSLRSNRIQRTFFKAFSHIALRNFKYYFQSSIARWIANTFFYSLIFSSFFEDSTLLNGSCNTKVFQMDYCRKYDCLNKFHCFLFPFLASTNVHVPCKLICQWTCLSNTATRLEKLFNNFVDKFVQLISLFHTNKLINNFAVFQCNYGWYSHHLQLKNKTSNNQTFETLERRNKTWNYYIRLYNIQILWIISLIHHTYQMFHHVTK